MGVIQNTLVTYDELITSTVDYIASKCCNIAGGTNLVNGYLNGTHPSDWNNKEVSTDTSQIQVKVTMTVNDSCYKTVSKATVRSELESFLKSRNLYSATNTPISQKSLINYVSNISAFVCGKMSQIVNNFSTQITGYLVYLSSNSVSSGIINIKNIEITKTEIDQNISSLINMNALTSSVHVMAMNISYNCSSSSSSCSSSSCSSSSSLFVAYMNIN